MTKGKLIKIFEKAIKENTPFIAVAIKNGNAHDPEIIFNLTTNFRSKLRYYEKAYEDTTNTNELVLKRCPYIKIVGVAAGKNPTVILKELGEL